jgi:polyisoprenoid-binding protein YceI
MKKKFWMLALGIILIAGRAYAFDTYKIDPADSILGFSVTHFMTSQVTGQFDQYKGTIVYDPADLAHSQISVTIQSSSIDTREPQRDGHLRGAEFLDAARFPTITFTSINITPTLITGDLTIKGVTKEVSIPVKISGPAQSPSGPAVIGITGSFKLNRQDYGVKWNQVLDRGGVAVSNEVAVNINVKARKEGLPIKRLEA